MRFLLAFLLSMFVGLVVFSTFADSIRVVATKNPYDRRTQLGLWEQWWLSRVEVGVETRYRVRGHLVTDLSTGERWNAENGRVSVLIRRLDLSAVGDPVDLGRPCSDSISNVK